VIVNTFAGGALDRAGARRGDPAWVARCAADPVARAVLAGEDGVLVAEDGGAVAPALVPLGPVAGSQPILLGLDAAGPVFAADLAEAQVRPAGTAVRGLRDVATRLRAADAGLLAHAAALLHWRRTARFCGRCGAATVPGEGGHVRTCPACGLHLHPRTDPVVIMLVADGDRVLLGRRPGWPAGRYSALAGFVEPGESLEEAVAREVREEAGVDVRGVAYRSSQPWPFPGSLMLGFEAAWAGGEAVVADAELEAVRWFTAGELDAARRGEGAFGLPGPEAIARRLVDGWLDARRGPGP
jgi:NAD+ diphosphatase